MVDREGYKKNSHVAEDSGRCAKCLFTNLSTDFAAKKMKKRQKTYFYLGIQTKCNTIGY